MPGVHPDRDVKREGHRNLRRSQGKNLNPEQCRSSKEQRPEENAPRYSNQKTCRKKQRRKQKRLPTRAKNAQWKIDLMLVSLDKECESRPKKKLAETKGEVPTLKRPHINHRLREGKKTKGCLKKEKLGQRKEEPNQNLQSKKRRTPQSTVVYGKKLN